MGIDTKEILDFFEEWINGAESVDFAKYSVEEKNYQLGFIEGLARAKNYLENKFDDEV